MQSRGMGPTSSLEERVKRFILSIVLMAALVATALPQVQAGKLATAIQEGKRAAALEMIRAGADVNEAQPDGTRPIHWASIASIMR